MTETILRRVASIRVSTLQFEESEPFQRYTKMSRFLLSKRKVFVADARDFDITPIWIVLLFATNSCFIVFRLSRPRPRFQKCKHTYMFTCNLSIMLIIELFQPNNKKFFCYRETLFFKYISFFIKSINFVKVTQRFVHILGDRKL